MRRLSGALEDVQALRLERAVEARRQVAPNPSTAAAGRDMHVIERELSAKEGEALGVPSTLRRAEGVPSFPAVIFTFPRRRCL